jgi:23S rRNA pseudouridine1911/1915/1917 synthase
MRDEIDGINASDDLEDSEQSFSPAASGPTYAQFTVAPDAAGQRLDRFLASQLPRMSRTHVQSFIDEGRVRVNGAAMKPSYRVEVGETVSVEIPAPPSAGVEPENIPLEILYDDGHIAIVNKPAGMIVHPGVGAESGTLVAALLHRFNGLGGLSTVGGPKRPGVVHRLDKGTSGLVVIARTDAAHLKLIDAFRDRLIQKTYVALLHGKPKGDAGTIDLPVARDLRRRSRMTARRREGRQARTDWRMRIRLGSFSFIEAGLHTGRTHQIRVHFSALGCPVVGDTLYGAPRQERVGSQILPALNRNFLHAARIAFSHPITGLPVDVRAPLPDDLVSYLRRLAEALESPSASIDAVLKEFL